MKTTTIDRVREAEAGLVHLRCALRCFERAGAVRTVARLRAVLDSAKGAVRAAGYRERRLVGGRKPAA